MFKKGDKVKITMEDGSPSHFTEVVATFIIEDMFGGKTSHDVMVKWPNENGTNTRLINEKFVSHLI